MTDIPFNLHQVSQNHAALWAIGLWFMTVLVLCIIQHSNAFICIVHSMEIQCLVHLIITNARRICQVIFITAVLIFLISVTIVEGYYLREIISGMN